MVNILRIQFKFDDSIIRRKNFAKTTVFYEKNEKYFLKQQETVLYVKKNDYWWGYCRPTHNLQLRWVLKISFVTHNNE